MTVPVVSAGVGRRQSSTASAYEDVFRHLRDPDAALTVQFNSRLVRLLAPKNSAELDRQNGRRAFELWREAQAQGVVPNLMTYNFLIRAANMAQEPLEVALDLFQRLLDEGLQPTRFTYNALLMVSEPRAVRACCAAQLIGHAPRRRTARGWGVWRRRRRCSTR